MRREPTRVFGSNQIMQYETKQDLLRHFHLLESFGYKYHEDIHFHLTQDESSLELPQNLDALKEIVNHCNLCQLAKTSTQRFFSYGSGLVKVLFIGDFPQTSNYDPFGGQSGKIFEAMCNNVLGVEKEDISFLTAIKCEVPLSSELEQEDINTCKPYLLEQIKLINPKVIVVFEDSKSLPYLKKELSALKNVITTYSANYVLRNPSIKQQVFTDLKQIKLLLEKE
jgi:uracil-DNA glycosylase family 4